MAELAAVRTCTHLRSHLGPLLGALLLLASGAIPYAIADVGAAPPTSLQVAPLRTGEAADYENEGSEGLMHLHIGEPVATHDGFGTDVEAIPVEVRLDAGLESLTAIDPATGTEVWSQDRIEPEDHVDRSFDGIGTPWAWGASVLAGRTISTGESFTYRSMDVDRSSEIVLEVGEPTLDGAHDLWPVEVTMDPPAKYGASSAIPTVHPNTTFWLDGRSAFPARVEVGEIDGEPTNVRTRVSLSGTNGPPAILASEMPERPWDERPGWAYELATHEPPPTRPDQGYDDFPLGDAIEIAYDHADGLNAFLESHEDAVFVKAWRGAWTERGLDAGDRRILSDEGESWNLLWGRDGSKEGWRVEVHQQDKYMLGELVLREEHVSEDKSTSLDREPPGPILRPTAYFGDVATSLPSTFEGWVQEDSYSVDRVDWKRAWDHEPFYIYGIDYRAEDAWAAGGHLRVDPAMGIIHTIYGSPTFVEDFDGHGFDAW